MERNNDFDNWGEQDKNKGEKAERYNIIAEKNFFIAIIIITLGVIFPFIFIEYEWKYQLMKFPMIVTSILYIISVIYTVKGYKIAKKKLKNMVMLHAIFPSATIVGIVICLAILYMFWNAFSGFGSAEVTFWQWIF